MYQSYAEYCEQDNKWLPYLPKNWSIKKIKHIVSTPVTDGPHTTPELLPDGVPFASAESVKNQRIDLDYKRGYISIEDHLEFCKKCKPQKEDIFMVKSGATTGNIAYVDTDEEFSIWSPLALIRSRKSDYSQKYVFYFMQSKYFKQQVEVSWNYGTQQNIGMGIIENLHLFVPSLKDQIAIADFLDRKTASIRLQIEEIQKMIELLKEKKEALIINAVTKGLDPTVPMKNCGIDWIGEIPQHWKVKKIKYIVNTRNDRTTNEELKYIGLEDVESKTGKHIDHSNTEENIVEGLSGVFFKDDILFGKLRPYLAKSIIADFDGRCSTEFLVLKSISGTDTRFLHYITLSKFFVDIVDSSTYGAKMPRASWNFIGNIELGIPSHKEQIEIANHLDGATTDIDKVISKSQDLIKKLTEYQEALITAAVTGKIDVRGDQNDCYI